MTYRPIFLKEPRYVCGLLGFYTNPAVGRAIIQIGAVLTGVALIAAVVGGISSESSSSGGQALFLAVSAWVIVLGFMRLFCTGFMWIGVQILDWVAECVPSLTSAMHFLGRAYWIVIEVFLSAAFLYILVLAILVGFGFLSLNNF